MKLTTISQVKQKRKESEINTIKLKKIKILLKDVLNQCDSKDVKLSFWHDDMK